MTVTYAQLFQYGHHCRNCRVHGGPCGHPVRRHAAAISAEPMLALIVIPNKERDATVHASGEPDLQCCIVVSQANETLPDTVFVGSKDWKDYWGSLTVLRCKLEAPLARNALTSALARLRTAHAAGHRLQSMETLLTCPAHAAGAAGATRLARPGIAPRASCSVRAPRATAPRCRASRGTRSRAAAGARPSCCVRTQAPLTEAATSLAQGNVPADVAAGLHGAPRSVAQARREGSRHSDGRRSSPPRRENAGQTMGAGLRNFVRFFYGQPSSYCWWYATGACRTVPQGEGCQQGDALAPALFAVGRH